MKYINPIDFWYIQKLSGGKIKILEKISYHFTPKK